MGMPRIALYRPLVIGLLCAAALRAQAVVSVGPAGSGCDQPTIQAAIDYVLSREKTVPVGEVDHYIGVVGDAVYNETLQISDAGIPGGARIDIVGGYAVSGPCNLVPGTRHATISADGTQRGSSVVRVEGRVDLYLANLRLTGAADVSYGGGISMDGAGLLDLSGVIVTENAATNGGGIYLDGRAPGLDLVMHRGTIVRANSAADSGGGLLAQGETSILATESLTGIEDNTAGGDGGGLAFVGHGSLTLGNSLFQRNIAARGGGMYIHPERMSEVIFKSGVVVAGNVAGDEGGGILLRGANLTADDAVEPAQIVLNRVSSDSGAGGGVSVVGPARLVLTGSVASNSAGYGGGIAMRPGDALREEVVVDLRAAGDQRPVFVANNNAGRNGGGIYLRGSGGPQGNGASAVGATLCAQDFRIDGNRAREGAAIYQEHESGGLAGAAGSAVFLNAETSAGAGRCAAPRNLCDATGACNEINSNLAGLDATTAQGAVVFLRGAADLHASHVRMQGNIAKHLIHGFDAPIELRTSLLSDNLVAGELVNVARENGKPPDVRIEAATIAHNQIGAATVIRVAGNLNFKDSIVSEATVATLLHEGGGTVIVDHVLTNPADTTLPGAVIYGSPMFRNTAARDYELDPLSPGIDALPAADGTDLAFRPRNIDLPGAANIEGPRDLGALESADRCSPDTIFCNGFDR